MHRRSPVGQDVGLGVKIGASEKEFTQGVLQQTANPLDLAIEGDGFFQVTLPDGTTAYTRDGSFKNDSNGSIVTADGYFLSPQITIPANATQVSVGQDGTVTALTPGQLAAARNSGRSRWCASRTRPVSRRKARTCTSRRPRRARRRSRQPDLNGTGSIQGGYLEQSNVSVVTEIVNLITAQRAFEANSKAVDDRRPMLATAVNTKAS